LKNREIIEDESMYEDETSLGEKPNLTLVPSHGGTEETA